MSTIPKKKRVWLRLILIGLACAAVVSLYPSESVVCPTWTIQVVDEAGNPLRGAFVRQVWQDYSIEPQSHEQDTYTDDSGHVSFPERTVRTPLLFWALGVTSNTVSQGVHTSYGPSAYILAYGDIVDGKRFEGSAHYEDGKPLPKQLKTRVNDLGFR